MDTLTGEDGAKRRPPNPILVGFIQEVRRLAEEVTRREEAAAARANAEDACVEEGEPTYSEDATIDRTQNG